MATLELILLLLAAVLLSAVLDQLIPKVSSPLIQIVLGLAIGVLAAGQVDLAFDSELFLVLFIAPLLYDEARNADKPALLRQLKPVLGLAIGLVFVTTVALGAMMHALIPSVPLAAAFALAAALGPTDAVAVGSLPDDIEIGERRRSLLKGEYLLNDASGIVAFQFAIAAVLTGEFSWGTATGNFFLSFFGGLAVGALCGWASNRIVLAAERIGVENTTFHVLLDLFIPFIIFLLSESCGASGIIAVVAGGLVRSFSNRKMGPATSRLSIVSSSVWNVFNYALNGIVFVLLGTQLPKAMRTTWDSVIIDNGLLLLYVLAVTGALLLIRFIWLWGAETAHEKPHRLSAQGAYSALLMTIAGPKGAVTLSIILTIPVALSSGSFFPQRDLIIFIACGVIVLTLLLSNFLLPAIAPKASRTDCEAREDQRELDATVDIMRRVIEELTARQTEETRVATHNVVSRYTDRLNRIKASNDIERASTAELRIKAIEWESEHVAGLIAQEAVHPAIGYAYLSRLKTAEMSLRHHGGISAKLVLFRLKAMVTTAFTNLKRKMPFMDASERANARRDLQMESMQWTIDKMQENMSELSFPSEDVGALVLEYQRALSRIRAKSPSATSMARIADKTEDVMRLALGIELEAIQDLYDAKRISRDTAKRLRDNVRVMQLDMDDEELSV